MMHNTATLPSPSMLPVLAALWRLDQPSPLHAIACEVRAHGWAYSDNLVSITLRHLCARTLVRRERRGVYAAIRSRQEVAAMAAQVILDAT